MNAVLRAIARRRSTRKFRPDAVGAAELEAVLTAGLQAPTAHNDQSCYFVVVQDAGLIREMSDGSKREMQKVAVDWVAAAGRAEGYHIYYDAPTVVIVATRRDAVAPEADASAAIENMMIAAESLGLGSCWIGFARFFFAAPENNRRFEIPEGYEVRYGLALGYKAAGAASQPPARKRQKYYHVLKVR
jgi:nitroreductase